MLNKSNFIDIFSYQDEETGAMLERSVIIPIVQRDYAQGRTDERTTRIRKKFLQTLFLAVTETPITLDFIYGDIDRENNIITLLDGQQRVTTLFLLYWYAAKKSGCDESEFDFLKRFGYETRYSSRLFCADLVKFNPDFGVTLSKNIEDQPWFTLGWKNDPTIRSMLVMLDAIDETFKNVPYLWEKLKNDAITFYFLPIEKMGLTDELYIKMNSRGKPLSEFENFKAELEGEISKYDKNKAIEISKKIDGIWTDLLWKYRDDSNTIDSIFLNYFRIICQIIAYKENQSFRRQYGDSFDLLNKYFNADMPNFEEHLRILELYFDCWYQLTRKQSLEEFFERHLTIDHDGDRVKVGQRYSGELNIFKDCVTSSMYTLPKLVLLYAFIVYISNIDSIKEEEFRRRLRVINNLIQNSQDEISDIEGRDGGNRMPAILRQIDSMIVAGVFDALAGSSFNANQLEEESEKIEFTNLHPELSERLFALEDHELLTGQIAIVGLDNYDIFDRFALLFNCDFDKVNRALVVTGDYSQEIGNNYGIFQFGAANGNISWRNLFHKSSKNSGFEKTRKILTKLLSSYESFSDELLDAITKKYIAECESKNAYDWRYYFVKYSSFRPNPKEERFYGKYFFASAPGQEKSCPGFNMFVMPTEKRLSENAYSPFLKEVSKCIPVSVMEYYNGQINAVYLDTTNVLYNYDFDVIKKMIIDEKPDDYGGIIYKVIGRQEIAKNSDGTDSEDRIIRLINFIKDDSGVDDFGENDVEIKERISSEWVDDVFECIKRIRSDVFDLNDVYAFEEVLREKHPLNNNISAKIRQQLQVLRDEGKVEFLGDGTYKKIFE